MDKTTIFWTAVDRQKEYIPFWHQKQKREEISQNKFPSP